MPLWEFGRHDWIRTNDPTMSRWCSNQLSYVPSKNFCILSGRFNFCKRDVHFFMQHCGKIWGYRLKNRGNSFIMPSFKIYFDPCRPTYIQSYA